MEGLSELFAAGASVASGGIFGFLGAGVSAIARHFQNKQQIEADALKRADALAMQRLQNEQRAGEQEHELAIASQAGAWEGLKVSHQNIPQASGWANNVRALYRPFFTTAIWVAAILLLSWVVDGQLSEFLGPEEVADIVRYAVNITLFTASSAGLWWFAERAFTPPGMRAR